MLPIVVAVEVIVVPSGAVVMEVFMGVVAVATEVMEEEIPCQVCEKTGHSALCYDGEERHANVAATGYSVDIEWYTDTGAADHITSKLDKLTMKEKYGVLDQVHIASYSGMPISHVGQCTTHTHDRDLIL
jgi:hypothetical protein